MENEREKGLREELRGTQDSKPKGDSLLKLIKRLQRLQASGPPASSARSVSTERSEVARLVAKYHGISELNSTPAALRTASLVLLCGTVLVEPVIQPGVIRCQSCSVCFPAEGSMDTWKRHLLETGHTTSEPVYLLRPRRK